MRTMNRKACPVVTPVGLALALSLAAFPAGVRPAGADGAPAAGSPPPPPPPPPSTAPAAAPPAAPAAPATAGQPGADGHPVDLPREAVEAPSRPAEGSAT